LFGLDILFDGMRGFYRTGKNFTNLVSFSLGVLYMFLVVLWLTIVTETQTFVLKETDPTQNTDSGEDSGYMNSVAMVSKLVSVTQLYVWYEFVVVIFGVSKP
jgi:hypothetical protein